MKTVDDFKDVLSQPRRLFIGGVWVEPSSDRCFNMVAPSTGDAFIQVAEAQAPDIDRAVAAAREAFDKGPWPRMSPSERAGYMRAMGRHIAARDSDLGGVLSSENG